MKKCTLCVDRIYNPNLPEDARVPACVSSCPAGARHFGDFSDPDSEISRLVAARGGFALMPEQECRPVNRYLPPRPRAADTPEAVAPRMLQTEPDMPDDKAGLLARWIDRALSR